ncbi:MAG: hypothetical protein CBD16_09585 [Betaproteobacteria bacterium TMED156]|nr:MAG: hypothetical protein CBD16_09585 [Betaproteobacteria bacterium TMED156]|tara:strand:- start:983 stop:1486 length:504 start_codon:yes stop_codon:yes gene_type:complete
MNKSKSILEVIDGKQTEQGYFVNSDFLRLKDTGSYLLSKGFWSSNQNFNSLELYGEFNLKITCTRCLKKISRKIIVKKKYIIFNTTNEVIKYYKQERSRFDAVSIEEKLTLILLFEEELLFKTTNIYFHSNCSLPSKHIKEIKLRSEPDDENQTHKPFLSLKQKLHK